MQTASLKQHLCSLLLGGVLGSSALQASVIHITDGDVNTIEGYDLTTGNLVYSSVIPGGSGNPYAIAATATNVHLASYRNNNTYTLDTNGNLISSGTYAGAVFGDEIDGTTDGTSFYTTTWGYSSVDVKAYDMNWENPTLLFSAAISTSFNFGIAYDAANGSMWLSNNTTIFEYSMSGTLLSSFAHTGDRGSLSFDNSDGTLWYVPNSSSSNLLQYSASGSLLTSLVTPTRTGNAYGSEIGFTPVPEPSAALLSVAAFGLVLRRRRSVA